MFGNDERDVVVLFVGAESLDFVQDRSQRGLGRSFSMLLQGFDEALFAELFVGRIRGFRDAIRVEGEAVPRMELAFSNGAIPLLEDTQHRGRGIKALHSAIAAEEQSGKMAAIGVAQAPCGVFVFGEEECREGTVGGVIAKKLVYRTHKAPGLIEGDGALAAQIRLQIGHQKSGGDSFS